MKTFPWLYRATLLAAVFCVSSSALAASAYEAPGSFWHGRLEQSPNGVDGDVAWGGSTISPGTPGNGVVDILAEYDPNLILPASQSYTYSAAGDYGTDIYLMSEEGSVSVASSQDVYLGIIHDSDEAIQIGVRTAPNQYLNNDAVAGTWQYISYNTGNGFSSLSFGGVSMAADGTMAYAFNNAEGTDPDNGGGTWSLDSAAGRLSVTPSGAPAPFYMNLGPGGIGGRFSTEDGDRGFELITQTTTGRTLDEVARQWTVQAMLTTEAGEAEILMGLLTIDAAGTFDLAFTTSQQEGVETLWTGQALMADDGMLSLIKDGTNLIMQGYTTLDAQALVLGFSDDFGLHGVRQEGIVMAVPEPTTLALLGVGLAAALRRRRQRA